MEHAICTLVEFFYMLEKWIYLFVSEFVSGVKGNLMGDNLAEMKICCIFATI